METQLTSQQEQKVVQTLEEKKDLVKSEGTRYIKKGFI